jgi:hypothetical protein
MDIRSGYAVSRRRGFLGALFSALLVLVLIDPSAAMRREVKQIKLTKKHIQSFIAAYKDMTKIYEGVNPDKPDPKVEAQAEAVAKKNGFASLAEYDDVSTNISMIHVRHRSADQEVHRATRTDQEGDRGAQGRQIRPGSGK